MKIIATIAAMLLITNFDISLSVEDEDGNVVPDGGFVDAGSLIYTSKGATSTICNDFSLSQTVTYYPTDPEEDPYWLLHEWLPRLPYFVPLDPGGSLEIEATAWCNHEGQPHGRDSISMTLNIAATPEGAKK